MTARGPARTGRPEPTYDPVAVVDSVLRLLVAARVTVSVRSIGRATESAQRLLRDLGVEPSEMTANMAYWQGVVDTIADRAVRPC